MIRSQHEDKLSCLESFVVFVSSFRQIPEQYLSWQLYSISFQIVHPLIILLFDAILSQTLKTSLSKTVISKLLLGFKVNFFLWTINNNKRINLHLQNVKHHRKIEWEILNLQQMWNWILHFIIPSIMVFNAINLHSVIIAHFRSTSRYHG